MKLQAYKRGFRFVLLFWFLLGRYEAFTQKDSLKSGRENFQTYCGSCHSVHEEIIGPALASITKKRNGDWLLAFVKNSQRVIASGDEYANHLAERYSHMTMPSFKLSNEEIENIFRYIKIASRMSNEKFVETEEINNCNDVDVLRGRTLFNNQCSSCHSIDHENYGPALASVTKRRPKLWLTNFIKNSQQVIKTGDPYAVFIFNKFDRKTMVPMEFLSEKEINDILKYIEFNSSYENHGHSPLKNKRDIHAYQNNYVESQTGSLFFKVFFISVASIGFILQSLLLISLYRYLTKDETVV